MPIPIEVRLICEEPFFTLIVFCDEHDTGGETIFFVVSGGREARITVGFSFVILSESRGRWRNTLFGVNGDETGIKHFLSRMLDHQIEKQYKHSAVVIQPRHTQG